MINVTTAAKEAACYSGIHAERALRTEIEARGLVFEVIEREAIEALRQAQRELERASSMHTYTPRSHGCRKRGGAGA